MAGVNPAQRENVTEIRLDYGAWRETFDWFCFLAGIAGWQVKLRRRNQGSVESAADLI